MKLPAHQYLDDRHIPYTRLTFPPTTEKGAANVAHALGYRERQIIKTLVFETKQGERVLVMVGGDQSAISGHLKKAIGSRDISLARPEVVLATTGYGDRFDLPRLARSRPFTGSRPASVPFWKRQCWTKRFWAWGPVSGVKRL